jgi:secreted trypsin-like serine protease
MGSLHPLIDQKSGTFLCSGSLFANDHILTAAHCVAGSNGVAQFDSIKAVFFPPNNEGLPEVHDVAYARVAPGYTGEVVDENDIELKSVPSPDVKRYTLFKGNPVCLAIRLR